MFFVKQNNYASAMLRADQIAQELGAAVYLNEVPEYTDTAVFVKDAYPHLVEQAKKRGCRIVYDPIDTFAYPDRSRFKPWHEMVDAVIAYSPQQKNILKVHFKEVHIIPHQWDWQLNDAWCEHDKFRPVYIGHSFNAHPEVKMRVEMISDPGEMMEFADKFNCHVTVRETDSYQAMMKPATKVVTAAAVGAVCLTTKDPSAYWLLGEDYPYWVETPQAFANILAQAEREFGSGKWEEAKDMMLQIRDKTSVKEIAKLYRFL